jgi:hypothetical protein
MNDDLPIANGSNGDDYTRGAGGKFGPGNKGGPGSPAARHGREIRERLNDALFKACSPDRLLSAVDALLRLAEAGDVSACRLLFERIAGPPMAVEIAERIEALEEILAERQKQT